MEVRFLSRVLTLALVILSFMIGVAISMPDDRVIRATDAIAKIKSGGLADFDNCTIEEDLDLSSITINGPAHFNHTLFKNKTNFRSTIFTGDVYLANTEFKNDVDFSDSDFRGNADFRETKFTGYANFGNAKFERIASFIESDFNTTAYFANSQFKEIADFNKSKFGGLADFGNSTFRGNLFFSDAKIKDCYFDWELVDPTDGKLIIIMDNYKQLRAKYIELGFSDEADDCDYELRKLKAINYHDYWYKFFDDISRISYGYGLKPLYPLVWSFCIIFGFSLYWWSEKVGFWEAFYFSYTIYISGLGNFFANKPMIPPESSLRFKSIFELERLLGFIFISLLLITLAKTNFPR
jgi:hypothetical protein